MLLKKKTIEKLVKEGKAGYTGGTKEKSIVNHDGKQFVTVNRFDLQRTDHYEL